MTGNGNGQTQNTTMNEATMTHAIADLVTCANLGAKQGMDSTIDHTGAYPELVAEGGITRTTSTQALAALKRYLEAVKAEWTWAVDGLISADLLTPQSAIHLSNGSMGYKVGGKNPRTVQALAYGLMKVRRTAKFAVRSAKNEAAIAAAKAEGGAFHAEGVDREYATEQKARKAWARVHFGADWWTEDKTNRLSQAVVQRGAPFTEVSEATEKVRAVQAPTTTVTTPAPGGSITGTVFTGESAVVPTPETVTTTPETVTTTTTATVGITDEIIIGMAHGIGSQAKTVEGARAFLSSRGITV